MTVDYLTHRKVKNTDIAPKYHTENAHEAIIDKETYLLAQHIRTDRGKTKLGKDKNVAKYKATYPFSAFIVCSECGRNLMRRYWNYGSAAQRVMQQCGGYIEGKGTCKAKATYQELLEGATIQMLNEVFLQEKDIVPTIQSIIKSTIKVTDVEIKIENLQLEGDQIEKMIANLIDFQVKNPTLSELDFNTKYKQLTTQLQANNHEIKKLESEYLANYDMRSRLQKIETALNEINEPITEVNGDVLRSFIYKMIAVKPDEVVFCIAGKKNYSDYEFAEKRHEFETIDPLATGTYRSEKYNKVMNYRVVVI